MIERFRAFLDRPLDPSAARAVVVLASAVVAGLALLVLLASSGEPARQLRSEPLGSPGISAGPLPRPQGPRPQLSRRPQQDPQDARGSRAAERAAQALRTHRALQRVPYRRGSFAVQVTGAKGGRAVLRITAPTIAEAHHEWHRFLGRFHDRGSAYLPRFVALGKAAR